MFKVPDYEDNSQEYSYSWICVFFSSTFPYTLIQIDDRTYSGIILYLFTSTFGPNLWQSREKV